MLLTISLIFLISTLCYALFVLYSIFGLIKGDDPARNVVEPTVSVVIAARNEEGNIARLLDDLIKQTYPSERLEIFVANDRSTDATASIIDGYAHRHEQVHAIHVRTENPHLSPKKNALTLCIQQARSEIILSTDADCRVGPDWVRSAVQHFTDEYAVLVGYSSVTGSGLFAMYQDLDFLSLMSVNAGFIRHGLAWSGSGQNLAYRRSGFTATGGFTPGGKQFTGDDVFLVQEIPRASGRKVRFVRDERHFVHTLPMPGLFDFIRQRMRWSNAATPTYIQQPLLFIFLLTAFMSNFMLLTNLLLLNLTLIFWAAMGLKLIIEALTLALGAWRFGRPAVLLLFPLWFLIQPVYIPLAGLGGIIAKQVWKP